MSASHSGLQRIIGLSPSRLDVYAVDLGRRVMEHRRAFSRRVARESRLNALYSTL